MEKNDIRIALVGCGRIGTIHVKAYNDLKRKNLDNFKIVSVCDCVQESAENLAREIKKFQKEKVNVYTDFEASINGADIVDICTFHNTHHNLATTAIEAGKHVLVEKPLGITMRAARKMVEAAEKNKRILAVAENSRRKLRNRAIKWILEEGLIGKPQMIFRGGVGLSQITPELRIGVPDWGKDFIIVGTSWRHMKMKVGAGCVLDNGIHDADLFRYFNGEVENVAGFVKINESLRVKKDASGQINETVENTTEDAGIAILKHKNGVICNWLPAYWAGHGQASPLLQWIYGENGCIQGGDVILDNNSKRRVEDLYLSEADPSLKEKQFPRSINNPYAIEIYDFLDSVRNERKPETDGWEGLKTEAICYGVIESSYNNSVVKIDDIENCEVENYQKEINEALGL